MTITAPVKRYVVFAGYQYYPGGGWSDFVGSFDALQEVRAYFKANREKDWTQIIDLHTGEEVTNP